MALFGLLGALAAGVVAGPVGLVAATAATAAAKTINDKAEAEVASAKNKVMKASKNNTKRKNTNKAISALKAKDVLSKPEGSESSEDNKTADFLVKKAQTRLERVKFQAIDKLKQHRLNRTRVLSGNVRQYIESLSQLKNSEFEALPSYTEVFQALDKIGMEDLQIVEACAKMAGSYDEELYSLAKGRLVKARTFDEQSRIFARTLNKSFSRAEQLELVLAKLDTYLGRNLIRLQQLFAENGKDWQKYTQDQQKTVRYGVILASTIIQLLVVALLKEDGRFSGSAREALLVGETVLYELE